MPEGPECRIIAGGLDHYANLWIQEIRINEKSRYFKTPFPGVEHLVYPLLILSVSVKGKLIIFSLQDEFGNPSWLLSTLGMEGRWVSREESNTGLVLLLSNDSCLFYDDSRHFGTLRYLVSPASLEKILSDIGPDILDMGLSSTLMSNLAFLLPRLRKKNNKPVAEVLLDQRVISGIGNYLRSDILYLAGIHPFTLVRDLTDEELTLILSTAASLLVESYSLGGFTIHTYRSLSGESGKYQAKIYGKSFLDDGTPIKKIKDSTGRNVFTPF
jgi:endonuclease VIII